MKKFYFLTAALVAASAMSAQQVANIETGRIAQSDYVAKSISRASASVGEKITGRFGGIKAPQKAVADGLYYNRPEGSFYYGWDINGGGWYYSAVVVAPWTEFTFKNMSDNPTSVQWLLRFPVLNSAGTAYEGYNERDVTEYADAEGNYTTVLEPGYYSVAPTIKKGDSEFTLSEGNSNWAGKIGLNTRVFLNDSLYSFSGVDHNQGFYYGTGAISNGYFWGTGTVDGGEDGIGTCVGIRQNYDKPMSPLYVDRCFIMGLSSQAAPIPAGKELSLYIINSETKQPTEVLTATADDIIDAQFNTSIKKYVFDVHFTKKMDTPLGMMVAPVVIDYPFTVQIEGFDGDGVDVGFYGNLIADGDNVEHATFLVDYSDGTYGHYYSDLALPLCFQALFDKVYVWETAVSQDQQISGVNVVRVSEDGQTCQNNVFSDVNGAIVNTATPWFDNDGGDMYFKAEDTPEWINLVAVYNETVDAYVVSVVCDPLPAGTKGRNAVVYIEGRGVTSETPILVVQGDAEIPSGINNATADRNNYVDANAPVYNLNGQRTTKAAKGLLIQNGKKYLNK